MSRPRLEWQKYQPRRRRDVQRTPQPGRCDALTPAERDQLEEERRKRLLGWFKRREGATLCLTALNAATQAAESCRKNDSQRGKRILRQ